MSDPALLILEGPPNGGQIQLAAALSKAMDCRIVRHDDYPRDSQPWHRYAQSLIDTFENDDGHTVTLMEGSWIREWAYRRNAPRFDVSTARGLERFALAMRTVIINCCPSESGSTDSHTDQETERLVHQFYDDAIHRHTALPIVRYNRDKQGEPDEALVDELLQQVDALAEDDYPEALLHELADEPANSGLIGSPYGADTLIMGDKAGGALLDLPFFGLRSCSPWLSYRLDESNYTEADLCWFNVRSPDGVFKDAGPIHAWVRARQTQTAGETPRIFTLGAVASAWAESEGLPVTRTVKHPQAHKRFSEREPYPLIEILESAGK